MIKLIFLATNTADAFELVTAVVIIVVTFVVLFLLYRNVASEIKKSRAEKEAMQDRHEQMTAGEIQEDKIFGEVETSGKNPNLLRIIDSKIHNSTEGTLGVLYNINLDDFRHIVDKYSQKDIDKVINEISKKLKKLGPKDTISGHLQADEFVYYYTGEVDADNMNRVGNDLLALISEPLKTIDETLTASIGLVVFPYDGINAVQLYKNAEIAVYVSKKEGKNRFRMYSEELIETEQFNANYYQEIKKSISNDEFLLYYQTIVDVRTGRIIGLESLLRWNHPTMGILAPARFLNVMELTGDITWFGTWGFEKIVSQYKEWNKKMKIRDLFISINISPKQLEVEGLADQFLKITKKYSMSPDLFTLEIMSYYTIIKNSVALKNLDQFRKYGFRIAVDDVGDKYEIINDMENISAGIIKISRPNVLMILDKNENSEQIQRTIEAAKEKSKIVIAEGIEDENMIREMAELGIRFMQGYYFNEPISAEEIEVMIKKSPWDTTSFSHIVK
ncbi:GGDEF and EAL domain-containing protein [Mycoplasmatota bacterium WC30]